MLTVEIRDAQEVSSGRAEIEIFCDPDGLNLLFKHLRFLQTGSTHVHLMTAAWAGTELGDKPNGGGTQLINHLKITMLPPKS